MEGDFQGRLLSGERLLWTGAPPTGFMLTGRDALLIPFSLFWCGFITFWMWGALHASQAMPFFPLFGIPFVVIGVYMLAGRFLVDAWVRRNTRYGVTTQRVLIMRTVPTFRFTTFAVDRLPGLSLEERADGRGTIRFQPSMPLWGNNSWSSWTPSLDSNQFLLGGDARSVFDRIQKAAKTA
jgi:hypothetical protein